MEELKQLREFAEETARQAGQIALNYFGLARITHTKASDIDIVTQADTEVEKYLLATIKRNYPLHAILSEESGAYPGDEYRWFIDPIDGTVNFAHRIPIFGVNLALARMDELLIGVTYDPNRNELFSAAFGEGAFLDGKRMRVSGQSSLRSSVLATGFAYFRSPGSANFLPEFTRIIPKVRGIRRLGAASIDMAYVACGRIDGYWERKLFPWDCAPGALMISEAGGKVENIHGEKWRFDDKSLVASNGLIQQELLEVLAD